MDFRSESNLDRRGFLERSWNLASGLALGAILSGLRSTSAQATVLPNPDPRAIVETTSGRIRGAIADGIHVFRGVPYGSPTNGAARFLPPRRVAPWPGIRDTVRYGAICAQERVPLGRILPGGRAARETSDLIPVWSSPQSEDCLNLNVWTPAVNRGGRRPVMVWLHPGGFEFASANIAFNEGTNLARRGDVVVVAINHRLGVFGYLHLGELVGAEYAHAGNVGMLDIVLALGWVRDNIVAFGGDPGCVMIHGESGGGRKVSAVLAMPDARGLFHRAAIQSGPGLRFPANSIQTRRARYVLEALGMSRPDLPELQRIPAPQLVAAGMTASGRIRRELAPSVPFYETYGFAPVLGPDLPNWPFDPSAPSVSAGVPLLIGTNRHEMSLAFTQDPAYDVVNEAQLMEQAHLRVGDRARELVDAYRSANPTASRRVLMLLLTSDYSHRMDSILLAERKLAQHSAPVYMYRFDWESPVLEGLILAAHTYEIPHVFDNVRLCSGMTGGGLDAVALGARMSSAWITFARSGDPNGVEGLPPWPRYDRVHRATMLFNDQCAVANDPGAGERHAWQRIGTPSA